MRRALTQETQETQEQRLPGKTNSRELDSLVKKDIPRHPGEWRRRLFRLSRRIHADPGFASMPPEHFRSAVVRWHQLAGATVPAFDEVWVEFLYGFPMVNSPLPEGGFLEAVAQEVATMKLDECRYQGTHRKLYKVCLALHRMTKGRPFYLSCRWAGELVGVSHPVAYKALRALEADGVIVVVKRGKFGKGEDATTYRIREDAAA